MTLVWLKHKIELGSHAVLCSEVFSGQLGFVNIMLYGSHIAELYCNCYKLL